MLEKKEYEVLLKDLFGTIEYSGEKEDVEKAYSELTQKQKDAVLWRTKGLTFDEVGGKLNISQTAARTHYLHALRNIRRAIKNRTFANGDVSVDSSIYVLNLSTRAHNALWRNKCTTLGDVISKSFSELKELRNMGTKSIDEIVCALRKYNFSLKADSIDLESNYSEVNTSYHIEPSFGTEVMQESLSEIYKYCNNRTEKYGYGKACKGCRYKGHHGSDCMFKHQPRIWSVIGN